MQVKFWRLEKRKNSTKLPPTECNNVLDCQLKEPTNVENPTIILKQSSWNVGLNYCQIPSFGCFYFVSDATYEIGGRVSVSLSMDKLATYRAYILNYTCFVERSASDYNDYFDDEYVSNGSNIVATSRKTIPLPSPFDAKIGCYVITVVSGGDNYSAGVTDYVVNSATLGYIMQSMFSDYAMFSADEVIKSFFNPFQYVVQLKWLPVDINWFGNADDAVPIRYGWWDSGQKGIYTGDGGAHIIVNPVTLPNNIYSDFRAVSPRFTSYSMFLPGYGEVNVPNEIMYHGINIDLTIDAKTGEGRYQIITADKNDVFATYTTQIGVPMQIAQMNPQLGSVVSGGANAVGSLLSGNLIGAASNLITSAQSLMSPGTSVNGVAGNYFDITVNSNIDISCYNRGSGERATSVAGRPCYATKRLGTLSGFVKCGNASISLAGYDSDMDDVNSMLNSGVYIE